MGQPWVVRIRPSIPQKLTLRLVYGGRGGSLFVLESRLYAVEASVCVAYRNILYNVDWVLVPVGDVESGVFAAYWNTLNNGRGLSPGGGSA
jgi:hypothetical protein